MVTADHVGARPATGVGAASVRAYWNSHIHDVAITRSPVGTREFFDELDEYRFDKLAHLPRLVDFEGHRGRRVLEIGCGTGTDLVRFAQGGADVTGVDLSDTAVGLSRQNLAVHGCAGRAIVADGAQLPFADATFETVYAHGVLQYAPDPRAIVQEALRVLEPGGDAVFMVYNRVSWLHLMSRTMHVPIEHADAPVQRLYSMREFRTLLDGFRTCTIVPERFPVTSRLHRGWKAALYNGVFVGAFNLLPRSVVGRFGWHLLAFCRK
jgi:SAM-dependent methyltransferase